MTSHCLNQLCLVYCHIYESLGLHELTWDELNHHWISMYILLSRLLMLIFHPCWGLWLSQSILKASSCDHIYSMASLIRLDSYQAGRRTWSDSLLTFMSTKYSGQIISVTCLLMSWDLASPQPSSTIGSCMRVTRYTCVPDQVHLCTWCGIWSNGFSFFFFFFSKLYMMQDIDISQDIF